MFSSISSGQNYCYNKILLKITNGNIDQECKPGYHQAMSYYYYYIVVVIVVINNNNSHHHPH